MERAARIHDSLVVELVELPHRVVIGEDGEPVVQPERIPLEEAFHPDAGFVPASAGVEIGMTYADGAFGSAPEPEPVNVPVPAVISDRQFAQQLAILGAIAEAEALAWAARGDLPAALDAAIAGLPESDRFGARMLLGAATTYERHHPLVADLGNAMGYDDAALDDLWRAAARL